MTSSNLNSLQAALSFDLLAFSPELILSGTIVLLLLLRIFSSSARVPIGWVALIMTVVSVIASGYLWVEAIPFQQSDLFGGMLIFDTFSIYLKLFLFSFTAFVIVLCMLTGIPDHEDAADFYCLLLGSAIGMSIMASANHLLMVFIGIEMASLPSYALAGFLKGRRQSSEAALKYVVYGGGAAGIMLYGISLLAGKFGTGYMPDVLHFLSQGNLGGEPVLIMGLLFLLIGIAFKLAAVPFHFWCPDVFEGAAAEVGAFLSVASKGAALALLTRIVIKLQPASDYLVPTLAFFAAVTTTFGNLAAYSQTNLKRLLAYSTIAHAGFMMMGLVTLDRTGAGAVLFYLAIYFLMNLGAFAVVAFLRNQTGFEDITRFRGLIQRSPLTVVALGVFLLSLLGLPPLAGFVAKFQIFAVLFEAGSEKLASNPWQAHIFFGLLVVGGLNSVLSLFYYVKVLRVMVLEKPIEEVEGQPVKPLPTRPLQNAYLVLLAGLIVALGIFWNTLSVASSGRGVKGLTSLDEKEIRK